MKKLIIGLVALVSISAFAQNSFIITNKTTPNENLEINCLEVECNNLEFILTKLDGTSISKSISKQALVIKSNRKLKPWRFPDDYFPYQMTDTDLNGGYYNKETIADDWSKGKEVKAVARSVLLPVKMALDTILLPYSLINYIAKSSDDRSSRNSLRKLLRKIERGENIEIKEVRFYKLVETIF